MRRLGGNINAPKVDFIGIGMGLAGLGASGLVSADQVVEKSLFAAKVLTAYWDTARKQPFRTFAAGQRIGKVYSWVQKDGILLWMMYPESSLPGAPNYYVPHVAGNFDFNRLQEQGTKTIVQQEKEAEAKKASEVSTIDKVINAGAKTVENISNTVANTSKVASYAVPIAIAAGAGIILMSLYKNSEKLTSKL